MTIVNYTSSIVNKLKALLTDDARVIIYDRHVFIVEATTRLQLKMPLHYHSNIWITLGEAAVFSLTTGFTAGNWHYWKLSRVFWSWHSYRWRGSHKSKLWQVYTAFKLTQHSKDIVAKDTYNNFDFHIDQMEAPSHRQKRIHILVFGTAHRPCFGWVVMSVEWHLREATFAQSRPWRANDSIGNLSWLWVGHTQLTTFPPHLA
jgi:hypothetical protein